MMRLIKYILLLAILNNLLSANYISTYFDLHQREAGGNSVDAVSGATKKEEKSLNIDGHYIWPLSESTKLSARINLVTVMDKPTELNKNDRLGEFHDYFTLYYNDVLEAEVNLSNSVYSGNNGSLPYNNRSIWMPGLGLVERVSSHLGRVALGKEIDGIGSIKGAAAFRMMSYDLDGGSETDNDMLLSLKAGYSVMDNISIYTEIFSKDDLNESDALNYSQTGFGLEYANKFPAMQNSHVTAKAGYYLNNGDIFDGKDENHFVFETGYTIHPTINLLMNFKVFDYVNFRDSKFYIKKLMFENNTRYFLTNDLSLGCKLQIKEKKRHTHNLLRSNICYDITQSFTMGLGHKMYFRNGINDNHILIDLEYRSALFTAFLENDLRIKKEKGSNSSTMKLGVEKRF